MLATKVSIKAFLYRSACLFICLGFWIGATAQRDSIRLAEQFLKVCNAYKKTPLQMSLEYRIMSNYILPGEDTGTVKAEFFTSGSEAYVSFGEVEEMIKDSLALLVSTKLKRMLLYRDASTIRNKISEMYDLNASKSNAKKILDNYSTTSMLQGSTPAIRLQSRKLLYDLGIPTESLDLQYDALTQNPLQLITIRRTLVRVSEQEYKVLKANTSFENKLMIIEENCFVVKETETTYTYKRIAHEADAGAPAKISDRISKSGDGLYHPVGLYKEYVLSEEN
jgi:hypothetical protein